VAKQLPSYWIDVAKDMYARGEDRALSVALDLVACPERDLLTLDEACPSRWWIDTYETWYAPNATVSPIMPYFLSHDDADHQRAIILYDYAGNTRTYADHSRPPDTTVWFLPEEY
jgi:hypothetical protein